MRKKILIVDDNSELLELLRLGLKQAGFNVATAANGFEALHKARSLAPDVVVLDLVLPELDGFAVCETLKRTAETADIPVIVLTGLSSEFTRFAGLEAGADEYVTKPVTPAQLVSKIECCLATGSRPGGPHHARRPVVEPRKRTTSAVSESSRGDDRGASDERISGATKVFA
ncbi:MAG TPA: response regulator [Verrucomicrobiae bacterium]